MGLWLFLILVPEGPLGALHLTVTRRAVFIAQAILALPYVVALSAAAVEGLGPGLLDQARLLGAGRVQLYVLALREARIGVMAALIAALGTALSEVGAIVIVGGNVYGYDQTLASAALYEANAAHYADAVAIGIVLIGVILALMGGLSFLQHQGSGVRLRVPGRDVTEAHPAAPVLLSCEHLSARRGERVVVRDASLELRRGELVALLGPNGAGKSTLLDALAGALAPAQGTIERRGRVAVALQSADLARRTVLQNVMLALAWWGVPRARSAQTVPAGARDDGRRAPRPAPGERAVGRRAPPRPPRAGTRGRARHPAAR